MDMRSLFLFLCTQTHTETAPQILAGLIHERSSKESHQMTMKCGEYNSKHSTLGRMKKCLCVLS